MNRKMISRRGFGTTWRALPSVLVMLTAAGLTGCGGDEEPSFHGSLAYVYDVHANSPSGASAEVLDAAVTDQRQFFMVAVDGEPREVVRADLRSRVSDQDARTAEINRFRAELRKGAAPVKPAVAEVDLLKGIDLAARSMTVAPRYLVIESSCLSTAGSLRFQQEGMVYAEPKDVADQLEQAKALPDLTGVEVTLRGCGDVVPPQDDLGIAVRKNLTAIWTEVLTRAGAHVTTDKRPRNGPAWEPGAPQVTPVELAQVEEPTTDVAMPLPAAAFFEPRSAALLDRNAAVEALRPLAAVARDTSAWVSLLGTTARVRDLAGQVRLSEERAEVIRGLLIELGVPGERISARGVGSEWCGYVPDHDGPVLLPDKAAMNRAVHVAVHSDQTEWDFCKS